MKFTHAKATIQALIISGMQTLFSVCVAGNPASTFDGKISFGASNLNEAAVQALQLSLKRSSRIEYAGCLFKKNSGESNQFHFTAPTTNGKADDFAIICEIPSGSILVGVYHTHPVGSEVGISSNDLMVANKLNVISYVAFADQKTVMSFTPGKTRTRCLRDERGLCPQHQRISDGDFVAHLK